MEPIIKSLPAVLFSFCFGGASLLAGGLLLFFALRTRRKSAASLGWPSAAGTVLESGVQANTSRKEDDFIDFSYTPHVEYTYQVNGQTFHAKRIHYGILPSRSRLEAERQADRFTPGMPVTVYYNPADPQEAVLEKRDVKSSLGLLIGLVFLGMAACTCLAAWVSTLGKFVSN